MLERHSPLYMVSIVGIFIDLIYTRALIYVSRVTLQNKNTKGADFSEFVCRSGAHTHTHTHKHTPQKYSAYSKYSDFIVTLLSKYTKTLTFQNFCQVRARQGAARCLSNGTDARQ